MINNSILKIENLTVQYNNQTNAIKNISCDIMQGDFIGLVGPNGGGKTTLAKTILGLVTKSSGNIYLFNKNTDQFSGYREIGYLPQNFISINKLFPATVEETVLLGLLPIKKLHKSINIQDRKKVDNILKELNIFNLKDKLLSSLSGGQQQKVLLARALVSNPKILILDEPSSALDPDSRGKFFELLKKINEKNKTTIILITHDTGYIGQYANKLLYIDRELVFFGKISDFCPSKELSSCFERSEHHIIWHQHN